ncbi:MAG: M48 family metallopeptidase [Desulfobacterales bacterium]|nr:M48 family metallopeptidase [Desulfobacterales bacterium]
MHQIKISNILIDVIRKDIKNMRLAVYPPGGRVRISVPLHINDETARLFAISKLSWIKNHRQKIKEQKRAIDRYFISRETHYFFGQPYLLDVVEHNAVPEVVLKNKTYISLFVRPNTTTEKRQSIMNEWYRSELKKKIPSIIEKYEKQIGVKVNNWRIKHMKTRWGSCNIKDKRIWINLELAKKPIVCLEYVILHELLHLIERYHNRNFKAHIEKYMPQWKSHKEELDRLPIYYRK